MAPLLALWLALSAPLTALGSAAPAQTAEDMRRALVQAQLHLAGDAPEAEALLNQAEAIYASTLAAGLTEADPAAEARLRDGFGQMHAALERADSPGFAAGRAQAWTALLAGSFTLVEAAVAQENPQAARAWLGVREYRQATRFSRPEADATLAVEQLARGEMTAADAVTALRADWFDTYQARLNEALQARARPHPRIVRRPARGGPGRRRHFSRARTGTGRPGQFPGGAAQPGRTSPARRPTHALSAAGAGGIWPGRGRRPGDQGF
jgi:high-affinity iron transporter